MILAIWLCSLCQSICRFIEGLRTGLQNILRNTKRKFILKRIGESAEGKCSTNLRMKGGCAKHVAKNLHQRTPISGSVGSNVIIDGNTKHQRTTCRWFASIAEKLSRGINTLNRNVAALSVPINYHTLKEIKLLGVQWCDVYDLEVEGVHEYFANGVLVHNCDPTALEHVVQAHGDLYIDEEIYSTGLTNPEIARRAEAEGVTKEDQIIADCAEPKSIAELRSHGLWVTPSPKGNDSIVYGLDILKRYRIHVTRRSIGLLGNLRSYKWDKDRDGNMTSKPEDRNNHGIDAIRYVGLAKLAEKMPVRGVRRRN